MPLPEYERVIYKKNPLEEVICQLRFPPILKIDAESPVAFQEAIRKKYPLYEEKTPQVEGPVPAEITRLLAGNRVHVFSSEDGCWVVTLSKDSISLTTVRYERWEEFRSLLEEPVDILNKEYSPAFYSRVGLRYKDVIRPKKLDVVGEKWNDLLQPHILGELVSDHISIEDVTKAVRQIGIRLASGRGEILLRHGLAQDPESEEKCFLIDADYFSNEKTEVKNAIDLLNEFNHEAGRLFRWCIRDKLHNAMEPTSA